MELIFHSKVAIHYSTAFIGIIMENSDMGSLFFHYTFSISLAWKSGAWFPLAQEYISHSHTENIRV